jgi:zinc protease
MTGTTGRHALENGLVAVWEVDRRQPLVAIEARILGGLRGEGPYLGTGITHFLEHMLFKGTPTRAPGSIDQEVRRYGGTINAFTSHDYTGVNLFVEAKYLPDALAMLSDILQHAIFPPEEFAKEREVVISEIQMNQDDPERRIRDAFWRTQFLVHPYRHPILGYQPLLEALTVDDMRKFYDAQYIPNNVVISCVGDLDGAAFPKLIEDTFGAWPRGTPYQVTVPEEPPPLSPRRDVETLPVQAGYALLGFPSIRLAHPDLYPLDVLASILGHGRSSRLYEQLVRKTKLAQVVSASNYTPFDPGVFSLFLRTEPATSEEAIAQALAVIEGIAREGVTEAELAKAKRQVTADYVFQHQTVESKAYELASSLAMTGDPDYNRRYVEEVGRVTREQVQRAAQRYLNPGVMTTTMIQPPGDAAADAAAEDSGAVQITRTTLPNGVRLLIGVDRHLPLTAVTVVSLGGIRAEQESAQGLSNLTAQLLLKGTSRRNASQIAEFVESLGGQVNAFSGRDGFGLTLDVLSQDLGAGLELVHELLTDSAFPPEEVELQRQLILKDLEARDDDPFDRASRLLRRTLFQTHPYRFDPQGTKETVQRLRREDCVAFAKQWLTAKQLVIAVFGDIDRQKVLADLTRRFGKLPAKDSPWPQTLEPEPLTEVRRQALRQPKEQSVILIGFRGVRVTSADRDPLDVLTAILSGMSGRLFQVVREQQGLAYTLGASHTPGWDPGWLTVYAATRPDQQPRTLAALLDQLQLVADAGVTEEELAQAKRYLIGEHRLGLQVLSGLARRSALDELFGLGFEAWRDYELRINAVTAQQVNDVARRYLRLTQRAEVIVGPVESEPSVTATQPAATP